MAKKTTSQPTQKSPVVAPKSTTNWQPWILAALALGLYAFGFGHPLVEMDDYSATHDNPAVTQFAPFSNFNLGMYAPLTWLFYAIAYQLEGGLDNTPGSAIWFHLMSALAHAVSAVLVYRLMDRGGLARWQAFVVALFFVIHPIQVESVAWVAGFSTPLYGAFLLGTLVLYQHYVSESLRHDPKAQNWYYLAIGCMLLACLAKSSAVVAPLLIVVLDLWRKPHYTSVTQQVTAYVPFFALSVVFGLLTIYTRSGIDLPFGIRNEFAGWERVFLVAYTPVFYLYKILVPIEYNVYYMFKKVNGSLPMTYYMAPLLLGALVYGIWKIRKAAPLVGVGVLFFLFNHAVTLPLAPVGSFELCADHYNYLACIGVFMALIGLYNYVAEHHPQRASVLRTVAIGWGLCLLVQSVRHLSYWSDVVRLIDNAMANGYDNYGKTYFWRGSAYAKTGKAADVKKAISDFTEALKRDSSLTEAYKYRGGLYGVTQNFAASVDDLNKYLATQPKDSVEYRYNRGLSYLNLNQRTEAMRDFNQVIASDPTFFRAFRARGNLYLQQGDTLRGRADLAEFERLAGQPDPARTSKIFQGR
jgi:protein O-mannosyl-transferase